MSAKIMRYKGSNTASLNDLTPNKLYQLNFGITDIDNEITIIDESNDCIYLDHDYLQYFEEVQNPLLNSEIYDLKVYVGNEINNQMKFLNLEKDKIYQINYYNSNFSYDFTAYILTDQGQKINLTADDMKEFKKFDENTIFNLNRSLEKIDFLQDQIKIKEKSIENCQNELDLINKTKSKYQFDAVIMVVFDQPYNELSENEKQLFNAVQFGRVYPMFYDTYNQEYWIFDILGNRVSITNYQHYFKNYNFDKEQNDKKANEEYNDKQIAKLKCEIETAKMSVNRYQVMIHEHNKELEHIRNFLEVEEDEDLKEAIAKLKDDNIVTDNILLDKEKLIDDLYVKIEKLHKVIKSLIDLV